MQLTSKRRKTRKLRPVISVTLPQLRRALVRNCNCFSQWSVFRQSFAVNLFFHVSERFVSHFMVFTFLNEREVLNKILLGMVCIFHQWSKFCG